MAQTRKPHFPEPTQRRLVQINGLLQRELNRGKKTISSAQIGRELGVEAHTIRKDINLLGGAGDTTSGYDMLRLLEKIKKELGLSVQINACIVGIGRLGEALLDYPVFDKNSIRIIAAFDVNINKLETLRTDVPLFPAYEMEDIIRTRKIEVAILTVPLEEVERTIAKLTNSGIKGIINYTGAVLPHKTAEGIYIRNLDINSELNMLKVLMHKHATHTSTYNS